jgi:adenylate cyclase
MLKKRWARGLAVGGVSVCLAFGFEAIGAFRRLEWKSWDARLGFFADPAAASKDIVLVLVDQPSLDFYARQGTTWPWPRELYGAIVRHLAAGGAKAVFFDIVMTEGSRFGADDDRSFAAAMREAGNVFVPVFLSPEDKESDSSGVASFLDRFTAAGESVPPRLIGPIPEGPGGGKPIRSITLPIPEILDAARGAVNVQVSPDADHIYRRIPLFYPVGELARSLPKKFSENPDDSKTSGKPIFALSTPWALASWIRPSLDPKTIPVDADGRMIIRFWGPAKTYRDYAAAAVINSYAQIQDGRTPQIPAGEFAGKIVLVGLNAVGLLDIKASPLSGVIPGVEIQAAALDTILSRRMIRVPDRGPTWIYIAVLGLLAGLVVSVLRKTAANTAAFAGFFLLPAVGAVAAFRAGFWLDFVAPEAAVLFALIGASLLNYSVEGREKRFLKGAFHHYLSPAVIDRILEDPGRLRLGGEQREITSFFSDVAGFTSISESLGPTELVALLNEYLTEMTDLILDSGGTLDKYEGDAIIAFWNAPIDEPDHALRACRTALACQARLAAIGPELERKFGRTLRMRIGLNTGSAVIGNMGSARRFDYTAIGDTINLAARLESAGKQYGVNLLAGEATIEKAGAAFIAREVDRIRVVGKSKPVRIFELIGETGCVSEPTLRRLDAYNRGWTLFRARSFAEAGNVFSGIEDDPVSALHAGRCRAFAAAPPPDDWDFVFDLKTK